MEAAIRPPPKLVVAPAFVRSIVLCKIQSIARCWPQLAKFGLLLFVLPFPLPVVFGHTEHDVFCTALFVASTIFYWRIQVNFVCIR